MKREITIRFEKMFDVMKSTKEIRDIKVDWYEVSAIVSALQAVDCYSESLNKCMQHGFDLAE